MACWYGVFWFLPLSIVIMLFRITVLIGVAMFAVEFPLQFSVCGEMAIVVLTALNPYIQLTMARCVEEFKLSVLGTLTPYWMRRPMVVTRPIPAPKLVPGARTVLIS